ncbi:MAG: hypothetical protein HYY11_02995 [Candidatus Methylomirabilis oxyfera]|nr:hypothetical protein [Candidatus Methylomirabilis oxyfera]
MPKSTRPSPPAGPPAIANVRDELNYHGRLLALCACMGGSLSTDNLITLSAYLLKAADQLKALNKKGGACTCQPTR